MAPRQFPKALAHGPIRELFPDVFFVSGTVGMPGPLPVRFSRNMTIVRSGGELTLVNSMRLSDAGLVELERLGAVRHVIRLAGFHGMDDPFYKDRYGARVWAVKDQPYVAGFQPKGPSYFTPDVEMDEQTALPVAHGRLYRFRSCRPGEALLHLDAHGGILVSGDCLQNWQRADAYFSLLGKLMMRAFGFLKPYNIGPGWLRAARPDVAEIRGILDLRFEHVLPAHGIEVIGNAREHYRPAIERLRT